MSRKQIQAKLTKIHQFLLHGSPQSQAAALQSFLRLLENESPAKSALKPIIQWVGDHAFQAGSSLDEFGFQILIQVGLTHFSLIKPYYARIVQALHHPNQFYLPLILTLFEHLYNSNIREITTTIQDLLLHANQYFHRPALWTIYQQFITKVIKQNFAFYVMYEHEINQVISSSTHHPELQAQLNQYKAQYEQFQREKELRKEKEKKKQELARKQREAKRKKRAEMLERIRQEQGKHAKPEITPENTPEINPEIEPTTINPLKLPTESSTNTNSPFTNHTSRKGQSSQPSSSHKTPSEDIGNGDYSTFSNLGLKRKNQSEDESEDDNDT